MYSTLQFLFLPIDVFKAALTEIVNANELLLSKPTQLFDTEPRGACLLSRARLPNPIYRWQLVRALTKASTGPFISIRVCLCGYFVIHHPRPVPRFKRLFQSKQKKTNSTN